MTEVGERPRFLPHDADHPTLSADAELLVRIGQSLVAEQDIDSLLQHVTDIATELTKAQFGAFFFNAVSPAGDAYQLYTLSGAPKDAFAGYPMPRSTGIFRPTFDGEGPVRIADVREDPRYGHNPPYHGPPEGHLPVRSYLAVPVCSPHGKVHGGLFFGHEEIGVFDESAERLAVAVASFAAVGIDNALLHERARQAIRGRDEFLAAAAHDLRTPLTVISARAQILGRRAEGGSVESAQILDSTQRIVRSVETLTHRIDWLTDVARTHMGGRLDLDMQEIDLRDLVALVVADYRPAAEKHGFSVELPTELPCVQADPDRIRRVLENLVNNAVKYSPDGGLVSIRLDVGTELDQPSVRIAVRDEGVGIPAEDLPHLFEPFHRGRNVPRQVAGSGIGLATAQRIVDEHGGRIGVESEPGQGTTFTVVLPVQREVRS